MNVYKTNLQNVAERINEAKKLSFFRENIKLIAVSKYVGINEIKGLHYAGCAAFGENKVQALTQKMNELKDLNLEWHFIGRLQKNKINQLLSLNPALIHSCDSFELAAEINKRIVGKNIDILLQINSAREQSKAGVMPECATETYKKIMECCPNLNLKGVMSIGAHTEQASKIQKSFELTREIYDTLTSFGAKFCSMGMSSDFELAIKCGSNILRLGTVLFK